MSKYQIALLNEIERFDDTFLLDLPYFPRATCLAEDHQWLPQEEITAEAWQEWWQ